MAQKMVYSEPLGISDALLSELCAKWRVRELSLFGSRLRNNADSDSDYDFLVTFEENAGWTLFEFAALKCELEDILGAKVDLVERPILESSPPRKRKDHILATAVRIYAR